MIRLWLHRSPPETESKRNVKQHKGEGGKPGSSTVDGNTPSAAFCVALLYSERGELALSL